MELANALDKSVVVDMTDGQLTWQGGDLQRRFSTF